MSDSKTAIVAGSTSLVALTERTKKTIDDAIPPNTRRAYEGDLRRFAEWCTSTGLRAMPAKPSTIALYMRHLADEPVRVGKKIVRPRHEVSTIQRAVAAICWAHERSGKTSPWSAPVVRDMLRALRRELGTRPKKKRAADDDVLRRLLDKVPTTRLLGLRDRAMLLLGWCGALRRSELVALDVPHVTRAPPKGLVVLVVKSKTDQESAGEVVPVFHSNDPALCPVRALDAWTTAAGITEGAIFRQLGRRQQLGERLTPETVLDRVQHWAKVAGLTEKDFGAHSLRRGFMTTAARRGRDLDSIMRTSRHRSEKVAREYIEVATIHERGAGEGLL